MSSHGFVRSPAFNPKPSQILPLAANIVAIAAGLAIVLSKAPLWLAALFVLFAARILNRVMSQPIASLRYRHDGRWVISCKDGRQFVGRLTPSCFVHRWLAVVVIRDGWRRCAFAFPRDTLQTDVHRRLRVALRWMGEA